MGHNHDRRPSGFAVPLKILHKVILIQQIEPARNIAIASQPQLKAAADRILGD
jgi:hypothetical protein